LPVFIVVTPEKGKQENRRYDLSLRIKVRRI
jgi:hypothetical protein